MPGKKINIFKPYLMPKAPYSGGKGRHEVMKKAGDHKIYKLSSNENILGSSPKALKAISEHISKLNEYPERTDVRLRNKLENFYSGRLAANQFVTENSGVSLIEIISRAFLNSETEIIVSNPCFKPYIMFAKKCNAKVIDVPLKSDDFLLDVDGIIEKITDRTRLIYVTNPNNPTGTYLPKNQIDELVDRTPAHVVVVMDEVYYQFADADDYVRAHDYVNQGKQVIGINSFSKAYGLAGLRLGYAYSTPEIAEYLRQLNRPFNLSTLVIEAGIAALDDDDFIRRTVEMVGEEKKYIYSAFEELGIKYWKSQANFIMIKPEMDGKLFEEALIEYGIMVRPVDKFGAPGCIRITIGDREANSALVNALKRIIK